MPTLYTTNKVHGFYPAYYASGRFKHVIKKLSPTEWTARRANIKGTGYPASVSGTLADQAAALAWCENDYNSVLNPPSGLGTTTTTAQFTQPAVAATVVVPVVSATGIQVGQSVSVAGGGVYDVNGVAGLSLTLKNSGNAGNAAPAAIVATGAAVSVLPRVE